MNILKRKIILSLILLFAFGFKLFAYESITFTWRGGYFAITATPGKQYTINWGDGSAIETITAEALYDNHSYFYTNGYYLYTVTINALSNDCKFTKFECQAEMNSLNFSNAPSMLEIFCWKRKLTTLDISKNIALTRLECPGNQLKTLDVSKNVNLEILNCANSQLSTLVLGNNTKLTSLSCRENSLTGLNISNCTALEWLYCRTNKLMELDVSKNKKITHLDCSDNKLKKLDLSKNTNLEILECSVNQITSIDVSKSVNLRLLFCRDNQLTTLDLRNSVGLFNIDCDNNRLKKIEFKEGLQLECDLRCRENQLPLSELYILLNYFSVHSWIALGTQRLEKKFPPGSIVDFSSQKEFGGIKTVFAVEKNGMPASEDDYTLIDGIFKFYKIGDYTITMMNDAISSQLWSDITKVIAAISVRNIGVVETQHATSLHLYPNPVSNILYIDMENTPTPPEVKIYSLQGVLVLQTNGNQIDVSSLPAGCYVANVNGINRKIIKQ